MDKGGRNGDDSPALPTGETPGLKRQDGAAHHQSSSFPLQRPVSPLSPPHCTTPTPPSSFAIPALEATNLPTEIQVGPCPCAGAKQPGWNLGLFLETAEVGSGRETWRAVKCFGLLWAQVNISEKERDLICRLASKRPLTRAVYHNAKVALFPILMYFWRRYLSIPTLPRWRRLWGCHPSSPATCSSA